MARTKQDPAVAKQKTALYNRALAVLRQRHPEVFEEILVDLYDEAGLTYRKRLSAEERAAQQEQEKREKARAKVEKALADFPDLLAEYDAQAKSA